jgi:hypothetical protein
VLLHFRKEADRRQVVLEDADGAGSDSHA